MTAGTAGDDLTRIETIAVTFEDLISALEFNEQRSSTAVLRLTPPFHGRMRARLHVEQPNEYDTLDGPKPIHIHPRTLIDVDAAPAYPDAEATRETLDSHQGTYTVDDHYTAHVETLAEWRKAIRTTVLDSTTISSTHGSVTVTIALLG